MCMQRQVNVQPTGLYGHDSNPLIDEKNRHPQKTKSEPSEAGPILRRKKETADMQFSRRLRNRGNGMEQASSDVGTHERIRLHFFFTW